MLRSFVIQSAIIKIKVSYKNLKKKKKDSFLTAINTAKASQFERTWKCAQQFSCRVETSWEQSCCMETEE